MKLETKVLEDSMSCGGCSYICKFGKHQINYYSMTGSCNKSNDKAYKTKNGQQTYSFNHNHIALSTGKT
jgi:hypothetical protein